jgi:iron complex outermembrane recepter protein
MKRLFLAHIMLLMAFQCHLLAQDQFTSLSGTVLDAQTKLPLPGAHVRLEETFYASVTNIDGKFNFRNIRQGMYTLTVSYVGYETFQSEVYTESPLSLEILLASASITTEEVIIRAGRAEELTPGTHQTISGKKLREISSGQDLPVLLDLTPSLVSTSDAGAGIGYTGLRIRGTDISRINVTMNGVPLNDPESHGVFWVNMPDLAGSVDNIQIQRGVGTSSNGAAAFGGSINIQTTKLRAEPFAELNSYAGSFHTFSNSVNFGTGLIEGRWAFDGRLSRISSDGYIDRAYSDLKSFFFNAGHYGEKNVLRFTMTGGKEKTYQAWGGVPKDSLETNRTYNPYTYENETDNYTQNHFHLNFMRQHSLRLSFNATAFLVKGKGYYEQYKENRRLTSYGLQPLIIGSDTIKRSDIIQQKHLDNIFYGINIATHYDSQKKLKASAGGSANHYTNDHFGNIIWMQYAADVLKDYQWYFNNGEKTDISGYIRASYMLTGKLNVFGDILYRHIHYKMKGMHDDLRDLTQTHTFDFINPKGGIYYTFNNMHECYASVAFAGREPSRNNFRDADENSVIYPERLIDYEAGYHLKMKRFMLSTTLFYMDYKDQLVLTGKINNVGDPVMVNVPESYRTGVEIMASLKLSQKIEMDANISFSKNKISDFTEWVDDWDTGEQISNHLGETDISFSPSVVSGGELRYSPFGFIQLAFISKYVSKQYIDNTSSEDRKLNPWLINNLRAELRLPVHLINDARLRFSILNIFDVKYESNAWVYRYVEGGQEYTMDGYFPQAGRHYMVGLNILF